MIRPVIKLENWSKGKGVLKAQQLDSYASALHLASEIDS